LSCCVRDFNRLGRFILHLVCVKNMLSHMKLPIFNCFWLPKHRNFIWLNLVFSSRPSLSVPFLGRDCTWVWIQGLLLATQVSYQWSPQAIICLLILFIMPPSTELTNCYVVRFIHPTDIFLSSSYVPRKRDRCGPKVPWGASCLVGGLRNKWTCVCKSRGNLERKNLL
jgi:hypothetical protein